jgi:NADH-quinone oxidoreductase subunit L
VVTVPLVLLAIPSVFIGYLTVDAMLFGNFFGQSIYVLPQHDVLGALGEDFHGPLAFALHGLLTLPFWLAVAGAVAAWVAHVYKPVIADTVAARLGPVYHWIENKYGFDDFNDKVFAAGTRRAGGALWKGGDIAVIDGVMVNGTARVVGLLAATVRHLQSGYLYHYAFAMIIGLLVLLSWLLAR